jgi:DNA-binding GntR family transcriptional regulator
MRASDRAYEQLRGDILDWRLEPGTVLAEVELAAQLGVSRTPVREALARLLADGLVESQGARGLVVSAASIENVVELFEVRVALEGQAAALAARRRDAVVFEELRDELSRAGDLLAQREREAYYDVVRRLDAAIDAAAGNAYLAGELDGLRIHLTRIRRLSSDDPTRLAQAADEHLAIVDAIIAGDPELARSATAVHLHRSLESIRAKDLRTTERQLHTA